MNVGFEKVPKGMEQSVLRQHVLNCITQERYDDRITLAQLKHMRVGWAHLQMPRPEERPGWRRYLDWNKPMDIGDFVFWTDGLPFVQVVTYENALAPVPVIDQKEHHDEGLEAK